MDKKAQLLKIFAVQLREVIGGIPLPFDSLQEIRLRAGRPLIVFGNRREWLIGSGGRLVEDAGQAYQVTEREIQETVTYISNYSLYAYEDEIKQGFMTIQGGHRIGVAGKIIPESDGVGLGRIRSIRYISFVNIRLAHQVAGCANPVMRWIYEDGRLCHTLIVSPPGCGKTTLLRDMIRQISDGHDGMSGGNVGLVDERSEIAACYMGIPQNDVGIRTDVLDGCSKAEGMIMLLRAMTPQVIAVDEIGRQEDLDAIEYVMNCGCRILATVHGSSLDELKVRPVLRHMMTEKLFDRYIVLGHCVGMGNVEAVLDAGGRCLYKNDRSCLCD